MRLLHFYGAESISLVLSENLYNGSFNMLCPSYSVMPMGSELIFLWKSTFRPCDLLDRKMCLLVIGLICYPFYPKKKVKNNIKKTDIAWFIYFGWSEGTYLDERIDCCGLIIEVQILNPICITLSGASSVCVSLSPILATIMRRCCEYC